MIELTKDIFIHPTERYGWIGSKDGTLFLTTSSKYSLGLKLARRRGLLFIRSQRLTKLGKAMAKLTQ
jgi:hypothetical protein